MAGPRGGMSHLTQAHSVLGIRWSHTTADHQPQFQVCSEYSAGQPAVIGSIVTGVLQYGSTAGSLWHCHPVPQHVVWPRVLCYMSDTCHLLGLLWWASGIYFALYSEAMIFPFWQLTRIKSVNGRALIYQIRCIMTWSSSQNHLFCGMYYLFPSKITDHVSCSP